MGQTYSIITTCKSRLSHLKLSLPKMLTQTCKEVIVVDYSCPEGTGEFVKKNFPSVRIVSVTGEEHFSNWKARNRGASVAASDVLVFVDADTVLADGAVDWLSKHFPAQAYGFFDNKTSRAFNLGGPRVAANQLKGFQVIPAAAFRRVGGYDEVLRGYAAGADTDLEERLDAIRLVRHCLDPCIIDSVIQHDAASRTQHHAETIPRSYGTGLLYRAAKRALLKMRREVELPLRTRQHLYDAASKAAGALGAERDQARLDVTLIQQPILMPRQLGYERGVQTVSLRVEVSLQDKLVNTPQ